MSEAQTYRLVHARAREGAQRAVRTAPDGYFCVVRPPNRSKDQNAKFHALVSDIAKAKPTWNGIHMDADDWKALLIVSHAVATGSKDSAMRMAPDLEGRGFVQLRESSARMSSARSSSLIEYVTAWAATQGIKTHG